MNRFFILSLAFMTAAISPVAQAYMASCCSGDQDSDGYAEIRWLAFSPPCPAPESTVAYGDSSTLVCPASTDNCPSIANSSQSNLDGDAFGDACDNCPADSNANQLNTDGDSQGDACDTDDDNDGVADGSDNCPVNANANQLDTDHDLIGDVCDPINSPDSDGDGVANNLDNCILVHNPDQLDSDGDTQGNACDADNDNDGVADAQDAFPQDSSASIDSDGDGFPDAVFPLIEGFETGNFNALPWMKTTENQSTWSVSGTSRYAGAYSAACRFPNVLTPDGKCTLEVSVLTGSVVSFRHFHTALFLQKFYIDGVERPVTRVTGTWVLSSYTLTPGRHQLKWVFTQGGYYASGYSYLDEIFLGSSLTTDNCPLQAGPDQQDTDGDLHGDVCDMDDDNDGVPDYIDANPLNAANATETMFNVNGIYMGAQVRESVLRK
jgi:hypothetical protein